MHKFYVQLAWFLVNCVCARACKQESSERGNDKQRWKIEKSAHKKFPNENVKIWW